MVLPALAAVGVAAVAFDIATSTGEIKSKTSTEASTATEEETPSPGQDKSEAEESSTGTKTATKGTAVSGTTVATEAARRKGLDRHAEAGLAEDLYAKEFERQGYTVVDDGSSVFTPDGGVDKIVVGESEKLKIQVKHYKDPVGHSTLQQYAESDIDVLVATNGVKDGVDPSDYGIKVKTKNFLSLPSRAKLTLDRIDRGVELTKEEAKSATKGLLGRLKDGVKWVCKKCYRGAKSMLGRVLGAAKSAASWFFGLSVGKQLLVGSLAVVTIAGTTYYVWKWLKDEESPQLAPRGASVV